MDKLQLVAKMAFHRAKEKMNNGEVPLFLGTSGSVALMYERIVQYGKSMDDNLLLDLAADALLVLYGIVPDMPLPNMEEETTTEQEDTPADDGDSLPDEGNRGDHEDYTDDPRWTPIPKGASAPRKNRGDVTDE